MTLRLPAATLASIILAAADGLTYAARIDGEDLFAAVPRAPQRRDDRRLTSGSSRTREHGGPSGAMISPLRRHDGGGAHAGGRHRGQRGGARGSQSGWRGAAGRSTSSSATPRRTPTAATRPSCRGTGRASRSSGSPTGSAARARTLLLEHIPEVVDRLLADGIPELNFFKELAPPELWEDGDDAFTGLWSRRPGFELAIRRVAEAEPGVNLCCPASAAGLLYDGSAGDPPHVVGVRLDDGTELTGDVVLDCGGRRTPVLGWLASDHDVHVPEDVQDCKAAYYTRHYRQSPSSEMSQLWLVGAAVPLERLTARALLGRQRRLRHRAVRGPGRQGAPGAPPRLGLRRGGREHPVARAVGRAGQRRAPQQHLVDGRPPERPSPLRRRRRAAGPRAAPGR